MKLYKRLLALILLCFSLFAIGKITKVRAAELSKINVYYYRYDSNYTNWFVWFWYDDAAGKGYKVQADNAGLGYKVSIPVSKITADSKLGVLLMKSSDPSVVVWGGEQTDDMYFDLADLKVGSDGTANVYYTQGDSILTFDEADAREKVKNKFLYLSFVNNRTIKMTPTKNSVSGIELYCGNNKMDVTVSTTSITIKEDVDFSKEYFVKCTIAGDAVYQRVSFDGAYDSDAFVDNFTYDGDDLGANYTKEATTFKLWAPISRSITLKVYNYGHPTKYGTTEYPGDNTPFETVEMTKGDKGVWSATVAGDLDGKYYCYDVTNGDVTHEDVVDPYAKSTGVNGLRGMVVNFDKNNEKLNPDNWAETPRASATNKNVDKILYETHVRDLTAHASWGGNQEWAGTYLGLAQTGTTYTEGDVTVKTGLDHLVELGVTSVHLLPIMDSDVVNETRLKDPEYVALEEDGVYNWGYMTKSFFTVDGCYSTNPYDGYARINEYKQLVMSFHQNGINIVMDVVYNHTSNAGNSSFHKLVPYYYHRTSNGNFLNGSGCGNEVASERTMVRNLIIDSLTYFTQEYKIDGYRFDLMALEDIDTMNLAYKTVSSIDPNTIFYGEPWTGNGTAGYANQGNLNKMPNIAGFCDASRNGIRGEANGDTAGRGWVTGSVMGTFDTTVYGITGGISGFHNSATTPYNLLDPNQLINYVTCHDNFTLYDHIMYARSWSKEDQIMSAATQALSIVLTSQGVPFIEGGSEVGRTKNGNHNSYNASDATNAIDYAKKVLNYKYFNAISSLIKIRKNHEAFRQTTFADVKSVMGSNQTLYYNKGKMIGYRLQDTGDTWNDIIVIHANTKTGSTYTLPTAANPKGWKIAYSNTEYNAVGGYRNGSISLGTNETVILVGVDFNMSEINQGQNNVKPIDPTVIVDNELINAFDSYLVLIQKDLAKYNGAQYVQAVTVANEFLNASYTSKSQLDAAWGVYKAKLSLIK